MQRPYNDRWERTRRYLLRNLLNPDLSPIPEETRSDSSDDGSHSPLPDLIVEREPNRHDHSEEFYEALAIKMRTYYKKLFIDGVSEHELEEECFNDAEDISEFEVNRSMASTFIMDGEGIDRLITNESTVGFDSKTNKDETQGKSINIETQSTVSSANRSAANEVLNVTDDEGNQSLIQEPSNDMSTRVNETPNKDITVVNDAVNVSGETQILDKQASDTIDTESDLVQSYHRISTTVAQIHDELDRVRAPRVFEDGSPVLMPRVHELNRKIFGNLSRISRNILVSVDEDIVEDEKHVREKNQEFDTITQRASIIDEPQVLTKSKTIIDALDSDLEVEWLMKGADSISNSNHESNENCEEEEISNDNEQNQTPDSTNVELVAFDEEDHKAIMEESPLLTSESDDMIRVQSEQSIGPNEFDSIELSPKVTPSEIHEEGIFEPDHSSFEMEIRKGIFESKNVRKTSVSSSDEALEVENGEFEEVEPVEVMRGRMQTKQTPILRRESTMSNESPLPVIFATQATAEELEEDNSDHDDNQINVSVRVVPESRDEDQSLQRESTASQDNSVSDVVSTDAASAEEELEFSDDLDTEKESSKDVDVHTPSVGRITSIADIYNELWSVSPVNINFEELSQTDNDVPPPRYHQDLYRKKRVSDSVRDDQAHMNKKKKYNSVAIQTGAAKEVSSDWDSVKNNFFVGKPLVFKLCSCHDHDCC